MRRPILALVLAPAVLSLGLGACSGGDDDAPSDVAGPSPVTEATTTSTVTTAVVTVATTAPTTTLPATTAVPTAPPATAPPSPPPAGPAIGPYVPVDAPTFPSRSAPPPAGDTWPDGDYYVVVRGAAADAPTPRLAVTIYQLLTGPDAIAAAQADGVGLDSDVYIPPDPAADRDIELTAELPISVARPDRPGVSYAISGGELVRLVGGAAPEPGAPEGYRYVEFPFLVTVQGGRPTAVHQLWAP